jgi:hypothetical protein
MAGNVTGSIGGSNVFFENAATEATLQMLLQATLATTKEQKKAIGDLVQKAGMDPVKVEQANQGLSNVGKAAAIAGGVLGGLNTAANQLTTGFAKTADTLTKFTDNQGKASDLFGEISKMGGVIGLFATGLGMAAKFQEQQLATYQNLTQNGISFGGSLTQMRLAASGMYLSMDQFAKLMKENSQTFAKMGSTADEGAQAFTKVSQELMKGPMGRNLQALGYTAEQVNSGLATYMDSIGALGANGEKDQKKLAASAAEYMTQLDALSEITGKSKDEQLAASKERAANAAWEAKLMTMSPEERKKAEMAAAEALARGGKGAEQALMSAVLGFPPMTKAAQQYTAIAGNMNSVTMKQAKAVTDSTKTMDDMKKIGTEYNAAAVQDKKNLGQAGQALIMQGGALSGTVAGIVGTANRVEKQGAETQAKSEAQMKQVSESQKKRMESEAATAVDTQRAVQQMGQAILNALMPAFAALQPYILKIAQGFADVVKWLVDTPGALKGVAIAAGALAVAFTAVKVAQGVSAVRSAFGGAGGGVPGVPGVGGGGEGPGKAIGGVADGLGKVGPMLSSLGKGAGDLFKGVMVGIASGLKVFANPAVALGAVGFAAAIAVIGAGIAAASWILGKSLPTLAEGLLGFNDLDGDNLSDVGIGMVALGGGLAVFGAGTAMAGVGSVIGGLAESFGSFFGAKSPIEKMKEFAALGPELGIAGTGIQTFNTSLASLLTTDLDKVKNLSTNLTRLATSLKELKEASKPVEKGFLESATDRLKAALTPEATKTPESETKTAASTSAKPKADVKAVEPTSNDPSEILRAEIQTLNKISTEILRAMRDTADSTKSTANTLASNGNLFRRG